MSTGLQFHRTPTKIHMQTVKTDLIRSSFRVPLSLSLSLFDSVFSLFPLISTPSPTYLLFLLVFYHCYLHSKRLKATHSPSDKTHKEIEREREKKRRECGRTHTENHQKIKFLLTFTWNSIFMNRIIRLYTVCISHYVVDILNCWERCRWRRRQLCRCRVRFWVTSFGYNQRFPSTPHRFHEWEKISTGLGDMYLWHTTIYHLSLSLSLHLSSDYV